MKAALLRSYLLVNMVFVVHGGCRWSQTKHETICTRPMPSIIENVHIEHVRSARHVVIGELEDAAPPRNNAAQAPKKILKPVPSPVPVDNPSLVAGVNIAELYHSPKCLAARNKTSFMNLQKIVPWASQEWRVMDSGYLTRSLWREPKKRPRTVCQE